MSADSFPLFVRLGDYAFSSTIAGASHDDAVERLMNGLSQAELAPATVVQVAGYVADWNRAPALEARIRQAFANASPAIRITHMPLLDGAGAHVQATAYTGSLRLFVTPLLDGRNPDGISPADIGEEIDGAFGKMCDAVVAAGGKTDEIVHVWAFAKTGVTAVDFTPSWLARFPSPLSRPARKTFLRLALPPGPRVTVQATALIGGSRRTNYEVNGVRHSDPLPMGARVGNLFMSSGIMGNSPNPNDPAGIGPLPERLSEQLENIFNSLGELLSAQRGSLRNVAHLSALVPDQVNVAPVRRAIAERFPAAELPALQFWALPVAAAQQMVSFFATAVF